MRDFWWLVIAIACALVGAWLVLTAIGCAGLAATGAYSSGMYNPRPVYYSSPSWQPERPTVVCFNERNMVLCR